jgi:hypothetical protein
MLIRGSSITGPDLPLLENGPILLAPMVSGTIQSNMYIIIYRHNKTVRRFASARTSREVTQVLETKTWASLSQRPRAMP